MINGIQGKYYAFTSASSDLNMDLISKAETTLGRDIIAKRLEIYTSGSLAFKINGGQESVLFKDGTGYYHLLLTDGDVYVSSLVTSQASACPVFVSMIYV